MIYGCDLLAKAPRNGDEDEDEDDDEDNENGL